MSTESPTPKPVEIVYDEERIKILIDETRKKILSIMSDINQEMSVTEIAAKLRTNPQRIYHHVDKLVEYGFLEKTREERKKRSVTTYYSRTAQAFIVSYSTDRGFIHDAELSSHFIEHFENLLGITFDNEEEVELSELIPQLANISEEIFLKYSNRSSENIQRHYIENLYFLLEYLIFLSNPKARELQERFNKLVLPKLDQKSNGIKTIRL